MSFKFEKFKRGKDKERNFLESETEEGLFEIKRKQELSGTIIEELNFTEDEVKRYSIVNLKRKFNPKEELSNILETLPGPSKDRALDVFKLRLAEQKHGFTLLQNEIFYLFESLDPEAHQKETFDKARAILQNYEYLYNLSENQVMFIENILFDASVRSYEVRKFFEENNGDPEVIFERIYKIKPSGDVSVDLGMFSIAISCRDYSDYRRIYYSDFKGGEKVDSFEHPSQSSKSGGVFMFDSSPDLPKLKNSIIGLNNPASWFKDYILKHEEQHSINRLYLNSLKEESYFDESLFFISVARDKGELLNNTKKYCEDLINKMSIRSRDEILAYKIESLSSDSDIISMLTLPEMSGGIYDYFNRLSLRQSISNILQKKDFGIKEDVLRCVDEIFIDKYHGLIEKGVVAFNKLKRSGYNDQQIVSILIAEKLSDWPKVCSRAVKIEPSFEKDSFSDNVLTSYENTSHSVSMGEFLGSRD